MEEDQKLTPDDEDLGRSQRRILRLVRKIHEAEEDEDLSREKSDLDHLLTTRRREVKELREKMSEEQEKALDDVKGEIEQSQDLGGPEL